MTYGREAVRTGAAVVTAVAEPRPDRRAAAAAEFGVADGRSVADWPELATRADLDVDAVVVATPDRQHTAPALAFLARGLAAAAGEADGAERGRGPADRGRRRAGGRGGLRGARAALLGVHHDDQGRRWPPGAIGDVVAVEHLEPVGWWHYAHSYVRGNWRREDESNPMLMAKCCHDVDWLSFVVDRPAVRVSSFGSLTPLHRGEQAGRGRVALPGLRRGARLPVLGPPDLPRPRRRAGRPAVAAVHPGRRGQSGDDHRGAAGRSVRAVRLRLRQRRGRPPGGQHRVRGRGHRLVDHDGLHPDGLPQDPDLRHPRHARGRRLHGGRVRLPDRPDHLDPGGGPAATRWPARATWAPTRR